MREGQGLRRWWAPAQSSERASEQASGTYTVYSNGDASCASGDFAGAVDELDAALANSAIVAAVAVVVAVAVAVVTDNWALH